MYQICFHKHYTYKYIEVENISDRFAQYGLGEIPRSKQSSQQIYTIVGVDSYGNEILIPNQRSTGTSEKKKRLSQQSTQTRPSFADLVQELVQSNRTTENKSSCTSKSSSTGDNCGGCKHTQNGQTTHIPIS